VGCSGWKARATVRGGSGVLGLESPSYGEGCGCGLGLESPSYGEGWVCGLGLESPSYGEGLRRWGVEGSNRGIGRES